MRCAMCKVILRAIPGTPNDARSASARAAAGASPSGRTAFSMSPSATATCRQLLPLAGGAESRHPSGQGHAHHQGRQARAGQSLHRHSPARCRRSGPSACAARKAWPSTPDGQLWEIEHGPRGGDEFNLIKKGDNYGWPIISHGIDYPGKPIGDGEVRQAGHGAAGLLLVALAPRRRAWPSTRAICSRNGRTASLSACCAAIRWTADHR